MNELDIFTEAIGRTDPAERAAYLEHVCAGKPELRQRLEVLLKNQGTGRSPLDHPAPAGYAPTLDAPLHGNTATFSPDAATANYPGKDEYAGAIIAGKYTLVEVVGEGGMGSVWRAKQTEPVKRFVAVKLIKAGMDSKTVLARFEAERQALALMDHPNIAKVLDGGLHEHRPFFVMELVKGTPITEYCDRLKLTPKARLELFVQVCQAIQHAHQKGIIHRDIKPSNVLIALYDDKPVVKVIDFGVAKATGGALTEHTIDTGFGGVVGTPQYMSPEQATFNNLDIDTRSDVYALGVLLYELLAGSTPFSGAELKKKGLLEILRVVREEEPPRPSTKLSTADALPSLSANRGTEPKKLTGLLRNELDWIVMKALEKDRTRRYETANGFAADVLRYLGGEAVQAHPPSTGYRLKKFVRRNKGQVLAASLVLFALLAGVIGTTLGLLEARRQAEIAREETAAKDKALTAETEQRNLAQAARDRAADSDAYARKTIDRNVDTTAYASGGLSYKTMTEEDRRKSHMQAWNIYREFYERELTEHPSGVRHEEALIRLALTFAMLSRKPEAIRTLDGLIDTLAARVEADPVREAGRDALVEALNLRVRFPVIMFSQDSKLSPDYRAARAEGYEYQLRAKELLVKIAPKQPWSFAYRKLRIAQQHELLQPLYAQARETRVTGEAGRLQMGKLPAGLAQQIRTQREEYYSLLREAMAHFPDAPEDATWLVKHVNAAAMEYVFDTDSAPASVGEEFLVTLFNIQMKQEMASPSPNKPAGAGVGVIQMGIPDQMRMPDLNRARLRAWEAACKEVPGYPKAETVAANMKTALFLAEMSERQSVPAYNQTPDHVQRKMELIAVQRKLLADVRSRPAAFPTDDGIPLHSTIRESMFRVLISSEHLRHAIELLAEWKREQAEAGKPAATAETLKRLKFQANLFRFIVPTAVDVSKEQATAVAEEMLREYEELFRDRAVSEDQAVVFDYVAVAKSVSRTYFEAKRHEDTIRVVRAAFQRLKELPPQSKDAKPIDPLHSPPGGIRQYLGLSLHNLKRYGEAVAEYEACIAVLAKEPELSHLAGGYTGDSVAAELMRLRLLRARAILHNGQPDEAAAAGLDAIRTYWEVCGRLQNSRGNFNDTIKYNASGAILREAPVIIGELRNSKATAQLDSWAAGVQPTLEQAAAEIFKRLSPKAAADQTAAICEQYRQRIWECQDRGDTKQAIAYADNILALKQDVWYAGRIQMSRARLVALSGDHVVASKAAKALLDAPNSQMHIMWFVADAALCYAACATACKEDAPLRERYAVEAVRLLRMCWTVAPNEVPKLSRFPEFRPHAQRDDFCKLKQEIDAKFPPPREIAPPPRERK